VNGWMRREVGVCDGWMNECMHEEGGVCVMDG
jgi:hypothetical protein